MANEKNLIPNSERTPSERRKNAQKAGQASGAARRRKKEMRELCKEMLELSLHNTKLDKINALDDAVKTANVTVKEAVLLSQIKKAVAGDTKAFEAVYKIVNDGNKSEENNGILDKLIEAFENV